MNFFQYLMAAPWWHFFFAFLIVGALSTWRPIKIVHNHADKDDKK
jgi:hypothetical protein